MRFLSSPIKIFPIINNSITFILEANEPINFIKFHPIHPEVKELANGLDFKGGWALELIPTHDKTHQPLVPVRKPTITPRRKKINTSTSRLGKAERDRPRPLRINSDQTHPAQHSFQRQSGGSVLPVNETNRRPRDQSLSRQSVVSRNTDSSLSVYTSRSSGDRSSRPSSLSITDASYADPYIPVNTARGYLKLLDDINVIKNLRRKKYGDITDLDRIKEVSSSYLSVAYL